MKPWPLILIIFLALAPDLYSREESHIFSTGSVMEVDRCASAWLIKRFVDKEAVFKFFPDGELIPEGTAFDTPDAKLTRTHNRSTFEAIVKKYGIEDKKVRELAECIHDIEINFWGNKKTEKSRALEIELRGIINQSPNNEACLERCFEFFDQWIKSEN